jgi:beta-phosphoglucomutase-like phosphatase (HAD superfamily)
MPSPVYPRLSPEGQRSLLRRIVDRCRHEAGTGTPPVVVFDLDGTLFDNRPRSCAILHDLAERWKETAPQAAERLLRLRPEIMDYLLADTLAHLGIEDTTLVAEASAYWRERFFGDDDLRHDVGLAGASSFAKACYDAGATLVYLTGRDLPMMGIGTFKSLRDRGFPIGLAGTELVLKPDPAMPDEAFKRFAAPTLKRLGDVVASFDNEPANCNIFLAAYPQCESVLLDTQHMPGAPALAAGVSVIADFVWE